MIGDDGGDDEFAEFDMTGDQFDEVMAQGEPALLIPPPPRVKISDNTCTGDSRYGIAVCE